MMPQNVRLPPESGLPLRRPSLPVVAVSDIEAAMRADACLAAGDMEGEAVWLRIVKAVEELRQREPGDRAVH